MALKPEMKKEFGRLLKEMRLRAGLTQVQLAQAIGVSDAYIVRMEKGVQGPPPPDRVHMLATALGDVQDDLVRTAIRLRSGYLYKKIYGGEGVVKEPSEPWDQMPEAMRKHRALFERICSVLNQDPSAIGFLDEALKLCESGLALRSAAPERQQRRSK